MFVLMIKFDFSSNSKEFVLSPPPENNNEWWQKMSIFNNTKLSYVKKEKYKDHFP